MSKKKKTTVETESSSQAQEPKKGLDIKVRTELSLGGRITVTVALLQDGVEVASDYDFITLEK